MTTQKDNLTKIKKELLYDNATRGIHSSIARYERGRANLYFEAIQILRDSGTQEHVELLEDYAEHSRQLMGTLERYRYACAECQQMKCDECKDLTLEYTLEDGRVRCYDCADRSAG